MTKVGCGGRLLPQEDNVIESFAYTIQRWSVNGAMLEHCDNLDAILGPLACRRFSISLSIASTGEEAEAAFSCAQ